MDNRQPMTQGQDSEQGAQDLMPELRLVRADNPSALTGSGTNTYLLGRGDVVVIDPGPALPDHLRAILAALHPGERISAILVTHTHLDHSALAGPLAQRTAAPVLGFGPAGSGRSAAMTRAAALGLTGGGEGVDRQFEPDRRLHDGESLTLAGQRIEVLHTPGHTGCHLAFGWQDRLFAGDHVMGWSTSLVSPPDGDMTDYVATLHRLARRQWSVIHPGHGDTVTDPAGRISELIAHRMAREGEILAALTEGPATAAGLAARIYTRTAPGLLAAASRNVLAHLVDLAEQGLVTTPQGVTADSAFRLCGAV